jgi:hypothetical protein
LYTNERISANYYPVTSWAFIHDHQSNQQLSLLTDRSVGCSSQASGSIEMLLHRRLMYDDGYGMEEALNELGEDGAGLVVRGKTQVLVGSIQESVKQMRILSKIINNKPLMGFSRVQGQLVYLILRSDQIYNVRILPFSVGLRPNPRSNRTERIQL